MAQNKSFSESESDNISDSMCESGCENNIGKLTNILTDFSTLRRKVGRPRKPCSKRNTLKDSTLKQDIFKHNSEVDHSAALQQTLEFILKEISSMRSDMGSLDKKVTDGLQIFLRLEQKISKIENENLKLKKKVEEKDTLIANQELRLDNIEQDFKRNEIVFSGPTISSEGENLRANMSRLVSSKLIISENKTARYSYRKLGKGSNTVLVTVDDLQDRSAIFRAARSIKPDVFFVSP